MPEVELTVTYPYTGTREDGELLLGTMLRELRLQFGSGIRPGVGHNRWDDSHYAWAYPSDLEEFALRRSKHCPGDDTPHRDHPNPIHIPETVDILSDPDELSADVNEVSYRRYRAEGRV